MEIDFLQNTLMLYIVSGMIVTWVCLVNSPEYRHGTRVERLKETLFCCAITGATSVPLVDYFTTVPSSIVLLNGALVGILGYRGITGLLSKFIEIVVNFVPSVLSGVFHVPSAYHYGFARKRDTIEPTDNMDAEPPPPRKRPRQ